MELPDEQCLNDALQVRRNLPNFDLAKALFSVGMDASKACSDKYTKRLGNLMRAFAHANGVPTYSTEDAAMADRSVAVLHLMKRHPDKIVSHPTAAFTGISLVEAMLLVGFQKSDPYNPGIWRAQYQKCLRRKEKASKAPIREPTTSVQQYRQPPPLNIGLGESNIESMAVLSPLTQNSRGSSTSSSGLHRIQSRSPP
jgi:hypothetical protein